MKRILILAAGLLYISTAYAQQDPQFTQWMYDKVSFNPAAAGFGCDECFEGDSHALTLFYRDQWDGLNRDPKTALFQYNGSFTLPQNRLGVGLTFYQDNLGQEQNSMIKLSGAYHFDLGSAGWLSAGVSIGQYAKKLGSDWVAIDNYLDDPLIPNEDKAASTMDFSLGVYYTKPGEYYVGLSSTHLSEADLKDLSITVARHYYFMGGYNYAINPQMKLRGNILAKSDFTEYIADINVNMLFNDMLWGGLTYRTQDAVAPMLGLKYGWSSEAETSITNYCLRVGYSYDATTSELRNYSTGSHEVFATLCLNFEPIILKTKFSNPRFL